MDDHGVNKIQFHWFLPCATLLSQCSCWVFFFFLQFSLQISSFCLCVCQHDKLMLAEKKNQFIVLHYGQKWSTIRPARSRSLKIHANTAGFQLSHAEHETRGMKSGIHSQVFALHLPSLGLGPRLPLMGTLPFWRSNGAALMCVVCGERAHYVPSTPCSTMNYWNKNRKTRWRTRRGRRWTWFLKG